MHTYTIQDVRKLN